MKKGCKIDNPHFFIRRDEYYVTNTKIVVKRFNVHTLFAKNLKLVLPHNVWLLLIYEECIMDLSIRDNDLFLQTETKKFQIF